MIYGFDELIQVARILFFFAFNYFFSMIDFFILSFNI